jgi:hypothetical protein
MDRVGLLFEPMSSADQQRSLGSYSFKSSIYISLSRTWTRVAKDCDDINLMHLDPVCENTFVKNISQEFGNHCLWRQMTPDMIRD